MPILEKYLPIFPLDLSGKETFGVREQHLWYVLRKSWRGMRREMEQIRQITGSGIAKAMAEE